MLFAVGTDDAQRMTEAAQRTNPGLVIETAADRHAATDLIRDRLRPGDIVLVKASRSLQLEDLAAALAASP